MWVQLPPSPKRRGDPVPLNRPVLAPDKSPGGQLGRKGISQHILRYIHLCGLKTPLQRATFLTDCSLESDEAEDEVGKSHQPTFGF